ncbi:MAG: histidinol-phosphate transaminase [Gammaproteobacteria bacterium]|nr:histidinol-phosphate transaminase [Gammaproteobacteria bacterium]
MNSDLSFYLEMAQPGLKVVAPYKPGKPMEELERELGIGNLIKLASNENPLGPPEKSLLVVSERLHELSRYPDGSAFLLKNKLAEKLGVSSDMITVGNGSNDVLEMLARVFLGPQVEAIVSEHCFIVYPLLARALGSGLTEIPSIKFRHDLEKTLNAVSKKTRVVFIANPNNPTGTYVSREELIWFLDHLSRSVVVVLDEAYFEYVTSFDYPNGLDLVSTYENLVVTRTFSKAYGMAGLRVGYAVSNPEIADLMNRIRQPFNVNSLSLIGAELALDEQDYIERSVALNKEGMQFLEEFCESVGLEYICSSGNFLSINMGQDAGPVYEALLKSGIIVRPIDVYGLPNHLRVSIGLPEENQRFAESLERILAGATRYE